MHDEYWWPVRVYHEDTDSGGIVYYASYLRFMERARTEWLRALGCEQDALRRDHNAMFVVVMITLEYKRAARFNDLLQVGVRMLDRRPASLWLAQDIVREGGGLVCRGKVRIACVDAGTLRPRPIPPPIHSELTRDH